jgi:hypothetical protein
MLKRAPETAGLSQELFNSTVLASLTPNPHIAKAREAALSFVSFVSFALLHLARFGQQDTSTSSLEGYLCPLAPAQVSAPALQPHFELTHPRFADGPRPGGDCAQQ